MHSPMHISVVSAGASNLCRPCDQQPRILGWDHRQLRWRRDPIHCAGAAGLFWQKSHSQGHRDRGQEPTRVMVQVYSMDSVRPSVGSGVRSPRHVEPYCHEGVTNVHTQNPTNKNCHKIPARLKTCCECLFVHFYYFF